MHLKNGVLRDLRKSMYNKIIELPISYYSEKKGDIMARMLGDVNEVQNSFFSILELVIKELLLLFCTRDHVYYQHKTDFIRFDFHANFRMDHFEISQEPRAKSLEAQKKVVN
jgi:subfamily B ATP-binding cassette protein MsbA